MYIQSVKDATGSLVNCDFFPIHITGMPTVTIPQVDPATGIPTLVTKQLNTEELLEYFRLNISTFIDPTILSSTFTPYIGAGINDTYQWNLPGANSLGSLIHIYIFPDNGSVIESGYKTDVDPTTNAVYNRFTFSTVHTPIDDHHPVSGNRRFGIYTDPTGGYTFFIGGLDRVSDMSGTLGDLIFSLGSKDFIYKQGSKLWKNIIQNFTNFIVQNGGSALKYNSPDIEARPDYDAIQMYLRKQISKTELKQKMGC